MQIQRPISLVFPPTPATSSLQGAEQDAERSAVAERAEARRATASTETAAASTTSRTQEDAKALSLQDQLELGKNRGLFAHITYTREGRIGQPSSTPEAGDSDSFAREAANVIREFSQDLAALKGEAAPTNAQWDSAPKTSTLVAERLRASFQSVASKLHVFA